MALAPWGGMLGVQAADIGQQQAVRRRARALGPAAPRVLAAGRDPEHAAHEPDRVLATVVRGGPEPHLGACEKMAMAFFKTSRSCRVRSSEALEAHDLSGLLRRRRHGRDRRGGCRPAHLSSESSAAQRGPPAAKHPGLDAEFGGHLHQRSTAALRQGRGLALEPVRERPSRLGHPTPFCPASSLAKVSTASREDQSHTPSLRGTATLVAT